MLSGNSVPVRNVLLAGLGTELRTRLMSKLEPVKLPVGMVLSVPDAELLHAYFVQEGMISLVQRLESGAMVEVGIVGREGFAGVPLVLGDNVGSVEAMVQIEGAALRMSAVDLVQEMNRSPALSNPPASLCACSVCSNRPDGCLQRTAYG